MVGALSVFVIVGCGNSVSAPTPVIQDDSHRRYHDGKRWVSVVVALDRLQLERVGPNGVVTAREVYLLRRPVNSVAALEDVARQVSAAQPDIGTISAYLLMSDTPSAQPSRLTHQVVLRVNEGQDLDAMSAKYRLRVINRVDYSPNTAICQVADPRPLAALDVANAARQDAGVIFATPLIEHHIAARSER